MAVEFQGDDDNAMFWRTLHAVIDVKGDKGSETAYEVPVRLQATCRGLFLYIFFWERCDSNLSVGWRSLSAGSQSKT